MWRIELGTDEQAGLEANRSINRGISGTAHYDISGIDFERECASGAAPI
jgi:hypothetical protein